MASDFVANTNTERLPPQNIEAEQAVLGSMLIDSEAVERVAQFLQPEDFYRQAHQHIFRAGIALYERREPRDFVTVCDELQRMQQLDEVGGETLHCFSRQCYANVGACGTLWAHRRTLCGDAAHHQCR